MVYKRHRLSIPSNTEYSIPQLRMMIREVEEIIGKEITAGSYLIVWIVAKAKPKLVSFGESYSFRELVEILTENKRTEPAIEPFR